MGHQATPVRLVVVGRDDQRGVHADLGGAAGEVGRVGRVVGAGPRDEEGVFADLLDRELPEALLLLVGERRALARRTGEHQAV